MSIRLRFTLWAAAIMLVILLGLSLGIHYMMARNLQTEMDHRLRSTYSTLLANPDFYLDTDTGRLVSSLENPEPFASPGLYIQVLDADFVVRGQTQNLALKTLPLTADVVKSNRERQATYYDERVEGSDLRIFSGAAFYNGNVQAYIQIAESREQLLTTLNQLRTILIVGTLLGTILVAGAAWLVADTALRPLRRMAATARIIGGAADLSERVDPPQTGDEVERLAGTFNAMLDRLEASFDAQRQFVADASHELRTPLTALRGNTDILLSAVRKDRIDRVLLEEGLSDIGGETDRLSRLVHDLLILARADVGWQPEMTEIDLEEILYEVVRIAGPLGSEHQFETDIQGEHVFVSGNSDQLKQLLLILLDNAFSYTPDGGLVWLEFRVESDAAVMRVKDSGSGIDQAHVERIFDRFYRSDGARARTSGGTGLGLAIARWIADCHGAMISAENNSGSGSTFTVRLPILDTSETVDNDAPEAISVTDREPAHQS